MKTKKTANRLPADERRAVTVKAVIELAAEQNPGEITTVAIAKRMHMTQGALFRHFATKDAIWQAVMEWVVDHLLARVDEAMKTAKSPLAALNAVFMTHIDFVVQHAGVPRILFGELQRHEDTQAKRTARKLMSRYGERLNALIETGKLRGELSGDVNTLAAVTLFIGAIQGLSVQSMLAGNVRRMRGVAPQVFAVYLRGIRRTP